MFFAILTRGDRGRDADLWVDANLLVLQLLPLQTLLVAKLHALRRKVR